MFVIIPGSLVLGFIFSSGLQPYIKAVPYMFAYVTLTMAIGCGLSQLREVAKRPGIMALTFVIAHVVSPLLAYGAGVLLYGADSPYVIGLVLFTIIPLGVSTVLWVGLSGGSVPLMLAMVVLDSALSPLVVPAGIHLFFDTAVEIEAGPLIADLCILIVLPTVIGVALNQISKGRIQGIVQPYAAPLSKLCFVGVVALNASAIAPHLDKLGEDMATLVPLVVLLVGACYALGFIGTAKPHNREQQITVSYATGMRNISLGIVLALGYFSPLTAVPVVLSILIQQPLATVHHYILQKLNNKTAGKPKPSQVR
ncbi:bile acid:sodium symporter family protein [Paenibacillus harenae]|uniref:Na+-dependent transporter n=1 Tax=Paenibacillus harenae TaxID=306543 RepID=A0ABT9U3R9_PAEHA|nr:bile acid:sodium symporter family protein [Paenibacillus harenae]MDQ0058824.1 putative Na+-dependent transporter [Paenibacillus harenae]MDQ0114286.1 putative Na+-dependent transporter [Paenibacillus harenae]